MGTGDTNLVVSGGSGQNSFMATIDQFSVAAVPIEMMFNDIALSVGTGFVWEEGTARYLITNWHNASGKDHQTGRHLSPTAAEPNRIRGWFNTKAQLGNKVAKLLEIRSEEQEPMWFVHPGLKRAVDVVAVPLPSWPDVDYYPINSMPLTPRLATEIGADVFVLGYPFGLGPAGWPVWKRGSIATEPEVFDPAAPMILVDTASRPGMSGSPVIRRSWGAHPLQGGGVSMGGPTATRLIGIYSGRLVSSDPHDAQLGIVWPIHLVPEIVAGQSRDT